MSRRGKVNPKLIVTADESTVKNFEEAISLFLKECRIKNLANDTLIYYERELLSFVKLLEDQKISIIPADVSSDFIKDHLILYMLNNNKRPATINAKLRALRALYGFLLREEYITLNPFKDISLVKQRKEAVETFTKEQISILLKVNDQERFTGLRDYTIMLILLETGIRLRELVDITLDDIRWDINHLEIRGKNGETRLVPFQRTVRRALSRYIAVRGQLDTNSLLVSQDDEALSRRRIQEIIRSAGRRANIKGVRCSPHTFRHTFAKISILNGADVFDLQKILGHRSLEMVRHYVNLFSSDVAKKHKYFSPVENL